MFFLQAEDGIRDLVRSRGLGDVYKRQPLYSQMLETVSRSARQETLPGVFWIVCPEHGVGEAVRVVRWTKALSDDMHHDMDAKWFIRGRYTSGNCGTCGMTLPVTRKKPTI